MKKIVKRFLAKIRYSENSELLVNRQLNHERLLNEILMANIFHDTMADVSWLKFKSFSPHAAAANYSFLYVLLRVLNEFSPLNILELGVGQSSKLTTQYVTHGNEQTQLLLIEHDDEWASFFECSMLKSDRIQLAKLQMIPIEFKNYPVNVYKDLINEVAEKKFDFLIIDGPLGSDHYSRIGVLGIIEKCLQERFVILIDDVDRLGEQELADEIKKELDWLKIAYFCNVFNGTKSQLLISSCPLFF